MRRDTARIFDEYLAASARAGDRASFGRLAARWQPKLIGHAFRLMGDADQARDVVQDAWADIARGLARLDDAAAFPAWAYRIVSNKAADAIRSAQRGRKLNASFAAQPAPANRAVEQMETGADKTPLAQALGALPPDQRAVVALFYREDFSVAEVAAALNVPAGTVKTRLMHARRKLRAALEGGKSDDGH